MNQNRIEWVDFSRGIGLIMVIAGHLFISGSYLSSVIFSFHMPLFFFLSGLLFRTDKCAHAFIKKKVNSLLIPFGMYVTVGIVFTLIIQIAKIFSGVTTSLTIKAILKDIYQGAPNVFYVGQLWFLISLFWVNIIAYFFVKYLKVYYLRIFVLLLFVLYVVTISPQVRAFLPGHLSPLMIDTSVMASVFFIIGYYLKDFIASLMCNLSCMKECIICSITFIVTLFSPLNGWVNIAIPKFGNIVLYFMFATSGILTTIVISDVVTKKCFCGIRNAITFLGANSMFIFAIHSLPVYLFCYLIRITGIDSDAGVCTTSTLWSIVGTLLITIIMFFGAKSTKLLLKHD